MNAAACFPDPLEGDYAVARSAGSYDDFADSRRRASGWEEDLSAAQLQPFETRRPRPLFFQAFKRDGRTYRLRRGMLVEIAQADGYWRVAAESVGVRCVEVDLADATAGFFELFAADAEHYRSLTIEQTVGEGRRLWEFFTRGVEVE